jgi:hypothetical protein
VFTARTHHRKGAAKLRPLDYAERHGFIRGKIAGKRKIRVGFFFFRFVQFHADLISFAFSKTSSTTPVVVRRCRR